MRAERLHFELIDVLLGVNSMCVIDRRETGLLVSDLVEFYSQMKGRRVTVCYSRPGYPLYTSHRCEERCLRELEEISDVRAWDRCPW